MDDDVVGVVSRYYGFSEADGQAAREVLGLAPEGFAVRFTDLARFAKTYGVGLRELAEFIARSGTGVEAWRG